MNTVTLFGVVNNWADITEYHLESSDRTTTQCDYSLPDGYRVTHDAIDQPYICGPRGIVGVDVHTSQKPQLYDPPHFPVLQPIAGTWREDWIGGSITPRREHP